MQYCSDAGLESRVAYREVFDHPADIASSRYKHFRFKKGGLMPPHEADWKCLAEQVSKEMDPEKFMKLVSELERVLVEREESLRQHRTIKRNQDQEIKPFRAVALGVLL